MNLPVSEVEEYRTWSAMRQRCTNENSLAWKHYGGRGIKVCDRWLNSFENFYADMGPRPSTEHSIDREDNDGDYDPDNCRWATREEQANNKRTTVYVSYLGEKMSAAQLNRKLGMPTGMVIRKLRQGMTVEEIVAIPESDWSYAMWTYDGVSKTLPDWAKHIGLQYITLKKRIDSGWSLKDALEKSVMTRRIYTHNGKTMTLREWSDLCGIDTATLKFRLRSGWSFEDAITRPKQARPWRLEENTLFCI